MLLVPVLGDSLTCCPCIDHDADKWSFFHQNGKQVVEPWRSNISLYEQCNKERNIDMSLKFRKKIQIYDVKNIHQFIGMQIELLICSSND